jgi:hypothetical protein
MAVLPDWTRVSKGVIDTLQLAVYWVAPEPAGANVQRLKEALMPPVERETAVPEPLLLIVTEATVAASAAMLQGKSTTQPRKARRSCAAEAIPFHWMALLIFSPQKGRGKRNTMERQVMI